MRDAHRMRERFELSLDNRQIVSIVISALVVLGAVFVLGVVVGKKLSSDDSAAGAPDLLTALDAKAESLEQIKREPSALTFHEELTRKNADPLPPPTMVGLADAGRMVEQPAVPTPVPELAKEPESPRKDDVVPVRTTDAGGSSVTAAIARAQVPQEAAEGGQFTLQLAASQEKSEAESYVSKLRAKGYAPFITEAEVPGRGKWYRVRMGSFPTREAANRYLADFRRETALDAFVAPNP